ncbi:cyclic pyranopterin monophosphate synthase MoaC [Sessilibacter sp. MAH2]
MSKLTHLNNQGEAHMVDVSEKQNSKRTAIAQSIVNTTEEVINLIETNSLKKGDVLAVARIAGIQAAKKTSELIPLCHPLMISSTEIHTEILRETYQIKITATCKINGQTGVEMEALTAASIAALTVYDMCKAVDKSMTISDTKLLEKHGGKSGSWNAAN